MAPEYGATMGFFPVDSETLRYLEITGRDKNSVELVEAYTKEQGICAHLIVELRGLPSAISVNLFKECL